MFNDYICLIIAETLLFKRLNFWLLPFQVMNSKHLVCLSPSSVLNNSFLRKHDVLRQKEGSILIAGME